MIKRDENSAESNESTIIEFKKLFSLFPKRDLKILGLLFFSMVIGAILELISIAAIPAFIRLITYSPQNMKDPILISIINKLSITDKSDMFLWGGIALLITYFIKNGYFVFNTVLQTWFVKTRNVLLSKKLFTSYMKAPYSFHLNKNTAELLRNTNDEVNKITHLILTPLLQVSLSALTTIFIIIFLIISNPTITFLILGIFTCISFLFNKVIHKKIKMYGLEEMNQRETTIKTVHQGLGSLKESKVLNREHYFIKRFIDSIERRTTAMRYKQIVTSLPQPFLETVSILGLLLIAGYLISATAENSIVIETLALFTVAITKLKATISQTIGGYTGLRFSLVSLDPVYSDLKLLEKSNEKESLNKISEHVQNVKWENIIIDKLSYKYPKSESYVLKDINIKIPRGGVIGFIGPTGAGKTTLVDVILGLLKPNEGDILLDDKNIYDNISEWQKNIGYIPQSIYLLDDSIRRNVALGVEDEEISDEKVNHALKIAQLDDFVKNLPHGLDTETGELGVRLSGGQRQRIGIARALYHDPKVLIMDEATSSLDNTTEKAFITAQENIRGKCTVIIIAHRLSTVQNCDCLYFIKNGIIQNSGSFTDLAKIDNDFRIMAEIN